MPYKGTIYDTYYHTMAKNLANQLVHPIRASKPYKPKFRGRRPGRFGKRYMKRQMGSGKMKVISRTVDCMMQGDGSTPGNLYLWNQSSGNQQVMPLAYNGGTFIGIPSYNGSGTKYNFTGACAFRLTDCLVAGATTTDQSGANFTSYFDRYKLAGVALKVTCTTNSFEGPNSNANIGQPSLYWRYDYDSANAPASLQDIKDDMASRYRVFSSKNGNTIKGFIKPRFNLAAQSNPTTGLISAKPSRGYLDMLDNAVPHFGFKWALADVYASSNSPSLAFKWEFKYYLTLRDLQL